MKLPNEALRGAIPAAKGSIANLFGQSERNILIGSVLLLSSVSAVTGFVLAQYYSVDVLSSLIFVPDDCSPDWDENIGRHCFSDYMWPVSFGMRPNPWEPFPVHAPSGVELAHNNYPAAGMLPQLVFGVIGKWLGAPLGLFGYLLALTIAVLTPAVWAARGALGLERVVVFVVCGVAAVPAWMAIDRGNSVALVAPIALVLLVALSRRRWGLVTIMVVLAALVKPQFVVLAVALFAARQWRWGGIAVAAAAISNVAAYLLWPRDFPGTIAQSIHSVLGYGSFKALVISFNSSFGKGILLIPDGIKAQETGGTIPDGFLAGTRSMIGYIILLLVVGALLALGRRIPPVMAGIVLLATAALFPAVSFPYYLVFVLPIAALIARDPDGPPGTGIFDGLAARGDRRRAVGVCVTLASAISLAQVALPSPPVHVDMAGQMQMGATQVVDRAVVLTTVSLSPILWLIACVVIIFSYARRSEPSRRNAEDPAQDDSADTVHSAAATSAPERES